MEDRRRLPLSLEESNRAKALTVRERILGDVSCPRYSGPPVYHLKTLHRYSVHLSDYVPEAKRGDLIADSLFDLQLQRELEVSGALNWSERGRSLHALKNAGQSNGLLDAVSVCMWGVSDSDMVLRTALHNTMAQGSPAHLRIASQEEEWSPTGQRVTNQDWIEAVELASPKARAAKPVDSPCQRVHLFVLANVIRRPIIVVGGSGEDTEAAAGSTSNPGPRGIYVPWLWDGADCHPYPVVLGSSSPWRRFAPLVTAGSAQDDEDGVALPLVWGTPRGLRELPLHFPPDGREGTRLSCLRGYLKLRTLPLGKHTTYAARLKGHNLPEPFSLVQDYFRLANHTCSQVTQEVKWGGREEQNGGLPLPACPSSTSSSSSSSSSPSAVFSITAGRCATERCLYFCSKSTWPLCHSCHDNRQQHQQRLQARNCPPEGRGFNISVCGDTPPSDHNPAPSCSPSTVGDDLIPQGWPSDLVHRPRVGGAKDSDFLCGRCLSCKMETRTFNGLCFRCLQSQTDPPALPPPDPTDTADPARASPGREGALGGQRCLTPGCVYFGTTQHAGYCTVCYCIQNQTPNRSPPPAPPLPSSSSSSSSSSPPPLQLSSTLRNLPRCADPACDMLGNSAFKGLCERCFLASHQGAMKSQASEAMAVSQGSDRVNRRHHRPPSKPDPPGAGAEKAVAAPVESRRSRRASPGKSQASAEPARPRPCLGSGCPNFGNSRCRGLCNSCYRSHV
ncbi:tumor necrosis factor alpha-induced protein 3-like [Anguilla rostrata]|uniref:tumor necrosis factor alpha-induced protein 3-like n=1 Tax=Anguilla rostrata TaxID=7938 RepID=UPI0030CD8A3C